MGGEAQRSPQIRAQAVAMRSAPDALSHINHRQKAKNAVGRTMTELAVSYQEKTKKGLKSKKWRGRNGAGR